MLYEWDEVGQLSRARRWDYTSLTGQPFFPTAPVGAAAVELQYQYSLGQRVTKKAVDAVAGDRFSVDVFPSLRLNDAAYDPATTNYERNASTETVYVAGLARVFHQSGLPGSNLHVFFLFGDHLGSANVVVDKETSEVAEYVTHLAYGATDSDYRPAAWQSFREDMRFTGKEEDIEVGLQYFGARYYSPHLARFVSADPLTVHAMGSDLNPYAYVRGRVFNATDPFGLADCKGNEQCGDGSGSGYGNGTGGQFSPDDLVSPNKNVGSARGSGLSNPFVNVALPPLPRGVIYTGVLNPTQPAPTEWSGGLGAAFGELDIPIGTASDFGTAAWNSTVNSLPVNGIPGIWATRFFLQQFALLKGGDETSVASAVGSAAPVIASVAISGIAMGGEAAFAQRAATAEAGAGASGRAIPGLAQLPMDVAVPIEAGEAIAIPRALAPSEMAALTNTTGNIEFSQTFSGGQYWLTRASFATPNRVQVLPWAADTVWLSHTHPAGYSGLPSGADRAILQQLGQGASRVVRPDGSSLRFGP